MPYLSLELVFDGGIRLSPSQEQIYEAYHSLLDAMASIAQELTSLEQWVDGMPVRSKNIKVGLPTFAQEKRGNIFSLRVLIIKQNLGNSTTLMNITFAFAFHDWTCSSLSFYHIDMVE